MSNTVNFIWVPVHSGVPGNEMADNVAGLGTIGIVAAILLALNPQ